MANIKHTLENAKDKIIGEGKIALGKVTEDDELILEGKVQSIKADVKKAVQDVTD